MKNADMPVTPIAVGKLYEIHTGNADGYTAASAGLTKREHFAAMAMQGLLASGDSSSMPTVVATTAMKTADELLAALEE